MPVLSKGRVGMVLETGFPPDARVEREALALLEAGYEVYLLCRKASPDDLPIENYKGIHISRVDPGTVTSEWTIPGIGLRISTQFPYQGVCRSIWKRLTGMESDWRQLIRQFIRKYNIDILHVHDLKLLKTGLAVAQREQRATKVIADLHENYPALIGHLTGVRKCLQRGRKKQLWWEAMERKTLSRVNRVIVVVEEARDRLLNNQIVSGEKISIVRNVVDVQKFLSPEVLNRQPDTPERFDDKFVLCYVGHVNGVHRGIQTILEALPLMIPTMPDLFFVGVGSIRKRYMTEVLQPIIQAHGLEKHVYFTGFRDESHFVPYIQRADICICPHLKTALTDTTFPNKIFLYNLLKKPVIVSDCLPLKRYVDETESGMSYRSGDSADFSEMVSGLYHNASLRHNMGENGYRSVMDRYCWDREKRGLIQAYEAL